MCNYHLAVLVVVTGACHARADTEPLYWRIFQRILDEYGHTYTWDVKVKLMGRQAEETARTIVAEYALPMTWEEFAAKSKRMVLETMSDVQLMPGV